MALPFSYLMALGVLSCNAMCFLVCDLPQYPSLDNREALMLLAQMQRISSFSCLKDRNNFAFPEEAFGGNQFQEAQAIPVVYEMIQQTFHLFNTEYSFAAWDETLLIRLCTGLYQQLSDLEACLTQEVGAEKTPLMNKDSFLAVKKYFQGITLYLQEKKYSPCAWEIIRVEIMRSLFLAMNLQDRLRSTNNDLV